MAKENPHECIHDEDLKELRKLKSELQKHSTRSLLLMGIITIFLFVSGFAATQAKAAQEMTIATDVRIRETNQRLAVQEERLKWILEGINDIKEKLEEAGK